MPVLVSQAARDSQPRPMIDTLKQLLFAALECSLSLTLLGLLLFLFGDLLLSALGLPKPLLTPAVVGGL